MTRKQIFIIIGGVTAIIIVLFFFGGRGVGPSPAVLTIWSVFDDVDIFSEVFEKYQKANKHITIKYEKKDFAEYEKELVNAFAIDQGPDILLIHNTWLPKHKNKLNEVSLELISFVDFKNQFVDVVEKDFTEDQKIYALPLYVDTLALYYNKDYLNSAGISNPADTWEDIIEDLNKLVKRDQFGGIERAGMAIGTAENINRSTDILGLLMLQNGTKMVSDDKSQTSLDDSVLLDGNSYYPGRDALRFYTDFASPAKRSYTWNRQMPYSIDAFIEGRAAMMLNYSYNIPIIKEKAPYLNFEVSYAPQIQGRAFDVNYANYWGFAVSKKSKAINEAWKLILYLTNRENSRTYLETTRKPTARKDLVDLQKDDLELGVFVNQSLTAQSWYQIDNNTIETILAEAIESIILGSATVNRSMETTVEKINLLMK
ncbi:extracellular solute-binding protein [Patescibacteria group bacterium]|nr:extracellular solute-binding protein [Patescibacteria group bacterium]